MKTALPETSKGVMYGLTAYTLWGSFPLFFALFEGVPAYEVLIHRVVWSCVFLALVVSVLKRWRLIVAALSKPRELGWVLGCAIFIAVNWGVYIYAVETHHVLQASLGYFLTPLVNVALGMLVLRESISRLQVAAVILAVVAILFQLVLLGELPWVTLVLAFSFGTYGLMRKRVALDGLSGLFVETLLLLPLALLALLFLSSTGQSHFTDSDSMMLLMMSSGIATALPLLAFAGAARRLKLATVGFLMYINPTIQFLIAVYVFNEPLGTEKLLSYVMIWIALGIYTWSAWAERGKSAEA